MLLLFQKGRCYLFYIRDTLDKVASVSSLLLFFFGKVMNTVGDMIGTRLVHKKKKALKAWNILYLRVTPTSFFFFPLGMELGQIYFYFVISPFCPFILSTSAQASLLDLFHNATHVKHLSHLPTHTRAFKFIKKKKKIMDWLGAELDVCSLISIRQLLWMFRSMILQSNWM